MDDKLSRATRRSTRQSLRHLESLEDRRVLAVNVVPTVETVAATAADDAAIWIHPTDTAQSTIIGTAKTSANALRVYDLTGNELQRVAAAEVNNVDLRYNFPLSGQPTTVVTGSNRSNNSIVVYRANPATRLLENVAARTIGTGMNIYGLAMYVSPATGKYYTFATSESGAVQQWELFDNGANKVDATLVRSFSVGSQSEGLVADDVLGWLYVSEEGVGVWKYSAEPGGGTARTQVDTTGGGGHLDADVEGLTVYYESDGTGYLVASSQGASEFAVYRREGSNQYLDNFKLVAGGDIDAVTITDGIDVTNFPLGSAFPQGMFVAQDNDTNFKLARWDTIDTAFGGLLDVDTAWDPRTVGAAQNSSVIGRHIFYNQSSFDDNSAAINANDDAAIALDKSPLLPGAGQATLANITSYTRGINGIMIDLSAEVDHSAINVNDFVFRMGANNSPNSWGNAPAPSAISVRPSGGVSGSDRVEITWADGAIANTYLEVQVLATSNTGLADIGGGIGDAFFWGNLVGETTTTTPAVAFARTVAADRGPILTAGTLANVGITNNLDINKSNSITVAADGGPILTAGTGSLARISIASAGPFAPEGGNEVQAGDAGIASALASTATTSRAIGTILPPRLANRAPTWDPKNSRIVAAVERKPGDARDVIRALTHIDPVVDDLSVDDELLETLVVNLHIPAN